jgi:hypothetical protein
MKRIKKSCFAAAICILLTGTIAVAQTSFEEHTPFKEQTGSWLQRSSETFTPSDEDTSGSLRDDPPGEPGWEGTGVPIDDALPLLISLSLVYMMVKYPSLKRVKN